MVGYDSTMTHVQLFESLSRGPEPHLQKESAATDKR